MKTFLSETKYSGYANIDSKDICIAMCYFNPLGYKNSYNNINTVLQELKKTNIPFYLIELIYPNQKQSLSEATVVVTAQTVFFVKENLWNILERHIPDHYEKIIFIDSDILCSDIEWVDKISVKLNDTKILHASEKLYRDITTNNIYQPIVNDASCVKESIVKGLKNQSTIDLNQYHPGTNICIDRNTYHQIGGFFEDAPGTMGDTLFWYCFANAYQPYCAGLFCAPRFKYTKEKYLQYKKHICNILSLQDIDYLNNNYALHLYHGHTSNRYYSQQDKFIPGLYTLYKNNDGVIEINIKHPQIKDMKTYFYARTEDSAENIQDVY